MKIRQRRNGDWCMEHNGVEAVDRETAEALTRAHFKTIAGKLGLKDD
ncbi:hypothetical protein [Brucella intermedia]|nr:hypothetical protein [Brucella intermedia]